MTPRENAHDDVLRMYRHYRTLEPIPLWAMRRVLSIFTYMISAPQYIGDALTAERIMHAEIAQEYLASMVGRTRYWKTPQPATNVPWDIDWPGCHMRFTGTGWPC